MVMRAWYFTLAWWIMWSILKTHVYAPAGLQLERIGISAQKTISLDASRIVLASGEGKDRIFQKFFKQVTTRYETKQVTTR